MSGINCSQIGLIMLHLLACESGELWSYCITDFYSLFVFLHNVIRKFKRLLVLYIMTMRFGLRFHILL